jgi:hypothetical protein
LQTVMVAARSLEPGEKRTLFLERLGALLFLRGQFADSDVDAAVQSALKGLVQEPAA